MTAVLLFLALEFLVLLPITLLQTIFYSKTLGFSQGWRGWRLALAIFLATALGIVAQYFAISVPGFTWVSLFNLAIFLLYPLLFMGGTRYAQLFFSVLNLAIFMFSILLAGIILYPEGLTQSTLPMMLRAFVLLAGVYAALVLAVSHISTEGKLYLPQKYWVGMIVCFALMALLLMVVAGIYNRSPNADALYPYLAFFSVAALLVWLLLYAVFYFVCRYFAKAQEGEALALQNDMTERYLLRRQAADERIQILSHDLKHSLIGWRALAEEKGDKHALDAIAERESQLEAAQLLQVGNESANAVLNQKCWEAQAAGVEFLVEGAFHPDLLVSRLDLCTLLGNLLDNAMEAAAEAPTPELRRVKLSIQRRGSLLLLMVEMATVQSRCWKTAALPPAKRTGASMPLAHAASATQQKNMVVLSKTPTARANLRHALCFAATRGYLRAKTEFSRKNTHRHKGAGYTVSNQETGGLAYMVGFVTAIALVCVFGVLAMVFACLWVYQDAKRRGMAPALWVVLVAITGVVIGLVLYLLLGRKNGSAPGATAMGKGLLVACAVCIAVALAAVGMCLYFYFGTPELLRMLY